MAAAPPPQTLCLEPHISDFAADHPERSKGWSALSRAPGISAD